MEDNRLATDNQKVRAALLREQGYEISEQNEMFPLARMTFLGNKSTELRLKMLTQEIQELRQKLEEKEHIHIKAVDKNIPSHSGWDYAMPILFVVSLFLVFVYLYDKENKTPAAPMVIATPIHTEPVIKKSMHKKIKHLPKKQDVR